MIVLTVLRAPKIIKLFQLNFYFEELEDFLLSIWETFNSKWLRVLKLFLIVVVVGHYFGCLFFFLSLLQVVHGETEAWIIVDKLHSKDVSVTVKYIRSFYWAVESLSLGCHGDILPHNNAETMCCIICALVGFVVVATVVGIISDLLAVLDKAAVDAQAKIDNFVQYASKQDLPVVLRERTMRYYEFRNEYTRGIDVNAVFNKLAPSFQTQVARHLYGGLLERTYIFSHLNSGLISSIAMLLRPQYFTPGDFILNQGDMGLELLILNYGGAEVVSIVDQCVFAVLAENDICGEISFFLPSVRRTASVRAIKFRWVFLFANLHFDF
jgi:hypothetical protein